jgi:predicted P-loop ATPase
MPTRLPMSDEENVVHFAPRAAPDSKDDFIPNPLNLRRELQRNALTKGLVAFDEFGQQIILQRPIPRPNLKASKRFEPRPWADADDTAIAEHFNQRGFKRVGRDLIRDVIDLEARSHPFHPVRDYLEGLVWDGTPRLSCFLLDYCGAVADGDDLEERNDSTAYLEAVTRAFFISAVARIFQPGCKADCMLILEGPQGALKSRLLRMLAVRDEWFTDSLPYDLAGKDARAHLAGRWLVEMGEIAQFRRSEIETVKSFLSCQFDRYRPAYGRSDISVARQCLFIGTTNATTYLHDPTGNRRFWPVRVGTIRLGRVGPAVDQLWAEAVTAYRAGESWWLSGRLERLAAREQQGRVELDPWHDQIAEFVNSRSAGAAFTTAQILTDLDVPKARRERVHEMRVGNVLRELGCKRWRARGDDGRRRYVYSRSEVAEPEEEETM